MQNMSAFESDAEPTLWPSYKTLVLNFSLIWTRSKPD